MISESLVRYAEDAIKKSWDHPAFTNYKGDTILYSQVAERIAWMHQLFKETGVRPGDKISLIGKNSINWAVTYLATVSYGAVIVPCLPDFHTDDMHHIINHSDSVMLFVSDDIYDKIDDSKLKHLKAIFSVNDFRLLFSRIDDYDQTVTKVEVEFVNSIKGKLKPDTYKLPEISNAELAAIVYTSGTSGFSKGCMLLHNSLSANVRYAIKHMEIKSGETVVSFLPLAHTFGCAFEFLFPFSSGAHIIFLSKIPSPTIILEAFEQYKPRLILSVPLVIEKIYKARVKPLLEKKTTEWLMKVPFVSNGLGNIIRKKLVAAFGGNFREIIIGGAPLSGEVQIFLHKIEFPFTIGYGMTECGPLISYSYWKDHRLFSAGYVMDTLEMKINSPDPANIVGEIMVRGENVMTGYYKNEEETKAALDDEGWLHTGDLGIIDKDGYVYIKGRCKNMLLGPAGENIYPEMVESKLNTLPYVSESLLIQREGKLVALVYPDMALMDANGVAESQLPDLMEQNRKELNSLMPSFINVTKIELYPEEFEKTATRKIKRYLYTTLPTGYGDASIPH